MIDGLIRKLQSARKTKGFTQGELGSKIGFPQSHISQIEAGKVDLRVSSLHEMAKLLDLEIMLIPRHLKPAVEAIVAGKTQEPAWKIDEEEDIL
ncbi:helix-turn-helix domain-containing protein [Alphaproteobacteria bacterium]|nr:helix-turn-helix domain-containing protein [Alphaproteobacteria bacterium]